MKQNNAELLGFANSFADISDQFKKIILRILGLSKKVTGHL